MRQRLGLAAALLRSPRLLLLDEPTSGLDPAGTRAVASLVRELAAEGVAVLLSSHQIGELERVCDAYTVMREGTGRVGRLGGETHRPGAGVGVRACDQRRRAGTEDRRGSGRGASRALDVAESLRWPSTTAASTRSCSRSGMRAWRSGASICS